jgi:DNA-directed RNA polymerase subunit N (RpoN/RPB10)
MLYISCPTCGYFLGLKTIEYEKGKEEICNNPDLSELQRNDELTKLLLGLRLRRYCCKMRMMTYKDLVQDIVSQEPHTT